MIKVVVSGGFDPLHIGHLRMFEKAKKEIHSIENTGKANLILIEVQTGSKLSEKDIVRLKDSYGRI